MSKIWVISDTHFNHFNIIDYANRPFKDIEEMNKTIIDNWNSVVEDDDIVFHLGDIVFGEKEVKDKFYSEIDTLLKGKKYFIKGNHDHKLEYLKTIGLKMEREIKIEKYQVIFTHKPMEEKEIPQGYINIHGHIHDSILHPKNPYRYFNASVEQIKYTPVLLEDILRSRRSGRLLPHKPCWANAKFDFRKVPEKCDVCGSEYVVYTSNAKIYHGKQYGNGYCYLCLDCKSSVGVHETTKKIPLGRLADRELKDLKMKAHALFDPYWKSGKFTRMDCYGYVASMLDLMVRETHFGWFDKEYLLKAISLLEITREEHIQKYIDDRKRRKKYELPYKENVYLGIDKLEV